jgi:hypothetical protein
MQKVTICGEQEVLNRWKEHLSDLPKEDIEQNMQKCKAIYTKHQFISTPSKEEV